MYNRAPKSDVYDMIVTAWIGANLAGVVSLHTFQKPIHEISIEININFISDIEKDTYTYVHDKREKY